MSDRLEAAHALRCALHAWMKPRRDVSMAQIVAAFRESTSETVIRKSVQRMVRLDCVAKHGEGCKTRYNAVGDAIYALESMRKRMRTGHANLLRASNRDRIAQAWAIRNAIHEFIQAHPLTRMDAITAAFPEVVASTLRKHVRALVKKQNVVMHGGSVAARYSCATATIYDLEEVRERLRENGRAVGALGAAEPEAVIEVKAERGVPEPGEPWKTVNRPECYRPLGYQGGQFERSGNRNGVSTLVLAG